MFGIEEVFRISSEKLSGYKTFMGVKGSCSPLPNAAVRASTAISIQTHSSAAYDLSISEIWFLKRLRSSVPMFEANVGPAFEPNIIKVQK